MPQKQILLHKIRVYERKERQKKNPNSDDVIAFDKSNIIRKYTEYVEV